MDTQELERIKAVKRFEHFDFALSNAIHGLLKIASDAYETPAAFITLIGEEDQWFKVNHGFEVLTMPRDTSFCTHTILMREPLIVADALQDARFADNPLVKNVPNIRFYAGAALTDYDGMNIGTLCVMDARPRVVTEQQKQLLMILAKQAIHLMQLEYNYQKQGEKLHITEQQNAALKDIAFAKTFEFRKPLEEIAALISSVKGNPGGSADEALPMIKELVNQLEKKIDDLEDTAETVRSILL